VDAVGAGASASATALGGSDTTAVLGGRAGSGRKCFARDEGDASDHRQHDDRAARRYWRLNRS
jgi:hypothetical protein